MNACVAYHAFLIFLVTFFIRKKSDKTLFRIKKQQLKEVYYINYKKPTPAAAIQTDIL